MTKNQLKKLQQVDEKLHQYTRATAMLKADFDTVIVETIEELSSFIAEYARLGMNRQ